MKLSAKDKEEWHEKVLRFIKKLKDSGELTDYNQIAFLFRSVTGQYAKNLADFLEKNGIRVYSPRSGMFFERDEIKIALGCLMLMFTNYKQKLEAGEFKGLKFTSKTSSQNAEGYYLSCLEAADNYLKQPENTALRNRIDAIGEDHAKLAKHADDTTNTKESRRDYAYSDLIYQLFEFQPFKGILDTDMKVGVIDIRPARNLANLTKIIFKFEYLYEVDVLTAKHVNKRTEALFNYYLKALYNGGMGEYEDDSEYAPSGCVSFMTIHQAKGMEFPIVFVGLPQRKQRDNKENDALMRQIEDKFRPTFEPHERISYFDLWRLYYAAFSRAQNLLVLTCAKENPAGYFTGVYNQLQDVESDDFDISEFNFEKVKDVNLKDTYSFTSHIMVYETCSLQYKFYKELGFTPVRASAMLFGMLVHETIEDIHRAALRHEEKTITEENIKSWFESNYDSLSKSEHSYLAGGQKKTALRQIQRYADKQNGDWSAIQQAEVDVSLVKQDYIIEGKIDLIRGKGDTVEIVDFKSESKPMKGEKAEELERYQKQLNIYAHLVEKNTGRKVSKMHLYYTGDTEKRGRKPNPMVSFDCSPAEVEAAMAEFDKTVRKIMSKDFHGSAANKRVCENCDFRHYCRQDRHTF